MLALTVSYSNSLSEKFDVLEESVCSILLACFVASHAHKIGRLKGIAYLRSLGTVLLSQYEYQLNSTLFTPSSLWFLNVSGLRSSYPDTVLLAMRSDPRLSQGFRFGALDAACGACCAQTATRPTTTTNTTILWHRSTTEKAPNVIDCKASR